LDTIPRGRMWGGATRKRGFGAYWVWAGGRWGSEGGKYAPAVAKRKEGRRERRADARQLHVMDLRHKPVKGQTHRRKGRQITDNR
jgi:hypothetical protein